VIFSLPSKTLIAAHRGLHCEYAENTLEAFKAAMALGVDMIELDVHATREGRLVVFHNSWIVLNGQKCRVRDCTYPELLTYSQQRGFHMPLLREVLLLTRGKIALDIELKRNEGREKEVAERLFGLLTPKDRFVITSFKEKLIRAVKNFRPTVLAGLLVGDEPDKKDNPYCIRQCFRSMADFWAPSIYVLGPEFLAAARKNKKVLFVWTVNKTADMRRCLKEKNVRAIISDDPEKVMKIKARRKGWSPNAL
jgi:glycerophosphoryl diester phosphodiesterase